ncbi:MAG TPA: hypothetical protein VLT60_08305 [Usitatibacter sp.]|nr:hypothetical protein [Usitatibacter sp.]
MAESLKPLARRRLIVGWRQQERRRMEIRSKLRPRPPVQSKPAA